MALLTSAQIRQIVRQPAVRTHYLSFNHDEIGNVNSVAMASLIMPVQGYANDTLKISTHLPKASLPAAAAYDENVTSDIPDTPYLPATTVGVGVQSLELSLVTSGFELQQNLARSLRDDGVDADEFLRGSILNAVRAEVDDLTFNGAGGIEPIGFLNASFPKQTVTTGVNQLDSIDEAIMAINCGAGVSQCDVIFCNRQAARKIASLIRADGARPDSRWITTTTGRKLRVMVYNSPQGEIPVVVTDFIPTAQGDTSLIMAHLYSPTGVHLAVPESSPDIRITKHRLDKRPSDFYIAEFKFALATLDTGKTVELTAFTV